MMYKIYMYRVIFLLIVVALFFGACTQPEQIIFTSQSDGTVSTFSVSQPKSDAAEPAVAADGEGNVYVLYVEHNPDKTADLFLQKRNTRAMGMAESITRVNPDKGSVKAWRGDPPTIAVASNGTIYAGWNLKRESEGKSWNDLMLSVSADGGKTFAPPVKVNDDTARASHGMHSLIVDGESVYMSWLDERNIKTEPAHQDAAPAAAMMFHHKKEDAEPNSEVFFSVSADGGKTFSANKKLGSEICPCCKTSMAAGPNGRLYVSWRQVVAGGYRHIAVASSADRGAAFSQGVVVSDDKWQIDACPVSGSSLAIGPYGLLSVVWYSAGEAGPAGIYSTLSSDGGRTFAPRQLLSPEAVSGTPVLTAGKDSCAFAVKDNKVLFRTGPVSGTGSGRTLTVSDASLPAAAVAKSGSYIAFVRTTGEKRAVWLARSPS